MELDAMNDDDRIIFFFASCQCVWLRLQLQQFVVTFVINKYAVVEFLCFVTRAVPTGQHSCEWLIGPFPNDPLNGCGDPNLHSRRDHVHTSGTVLGVPAYNLWHFGEQQLQVFPNVEVFQCAVLAQVGVLGLHRNLYLAFWVSDLLEFRRETGVSQEVERSRRGTHLLGVLWPMLRRI